MTLLLCLRGRPRGLLVWGGGGGGAAAAWALGAAAWLALEGPAALAALLEGGAGAGAGSGLVKGLALGLLPLRLRGALVMSMAACIMPASIPLAFGDEMSISFPRWKRGGTDGWRLDSRTSRTAMSAALWPVPSGSGTSSLIRAPASFLALEWDFMGSPTSLAAFWMSSASTLP